MARGKVSRKYKSIPNVKSRALMERLGMVEEPDRFEHPDVPTSSRPRIPCAHRLSKGPWVAATADKALQADVPARQSSPILALRG